MAELTQNVLEDMVRVIVEASDPERVILFGSQGRGEASTGSDVDLLIVESEPFDANRSRRKEMAMLWRALSSFPFAKDILVCSRDEAEYWRESLNNVIARALREGKVLYERP
jgi:predicted nucleotidyltransferase